MPFDSLAHGCGVFFFSFTEVLGCDFGFSSEIESHSLFRPVSQIGGGILIIQEFDLLLQPPQHILSIFDDVIDLRSDLSV